MVSSYIKQSQRNQIALLFLVCLLAFTLRLPGISWGVVSVAPPKLLIYIHDERQMANIAQEFTKDFIDNVGVYPKGFPFQMALVSLAVKPFVELDNPELIMAGRLLTLVYSILGIVLLFFLVKEVTANQNLAILSSLFLALNGLHVSRSYLAMPDIAMVFWLYLIMYCTLCYLRTNRFKYFVFATIATGIVLAIKFPLMAVIPILYVMITKKWGWKVVLGVSLAVFAVFYLANGGKYTLSGFLMTLSNVSVDNLNVRQFNKFLNPVCYFFILISSMGLPVFLLTIAGFLRFISNKIAVSVFLRKDLFFIVLLPLLVHFLIICNLAFPADRHILPLMPVLCLIAAAGFIQLKELQFFSNNLMHSVLLSFVVIYQTVYAGSIVFNCVYDTRKAATEWVKMNIPQGATIALPKYSYLANIHQDYSIKDLPQADFVVLHEAYYGRYSKTIMNPFTEYPLWQNVFHGIPNDFKLIPAILKEELPYRLLKRFELTFITPELIVLRKIFGNLWDGGLGEVRIYQKISPVEQR